MEEEAIPSGGGGSGDDVVADVPFCVGAWVGDEGDGPVGSVGVALDHLAGSVGEGFDVASIALRRFSARRLSHHAPFPAG